MHHIARILQHAVPGEAFTDGAKHSAHDAERTGAAESDGLARFLGIQTVRNNNGDLIAMNRNGILAILDDKGR